MLEGCDKQLGSHENLISRDADLLDSLSDFPFVSIRASTIDVSVAEL